MDNIELEKLSPQKLIALYGQVLRQLKSSGVVRSKNIVGDLGEYVAIEHYRKDKRLPRLQAAPPNTENIDAISAKGDRYAIKATTSKTTSVFRGLNPKGSAQEEKQRFEYVVIVVFDDDMSLAQILELDWAAFLKHKKWHSRTAAWKLNINQALINDSAVLYKSRGGS